MNNLTGYQENKYKWRSAIDFGEIVVPSWLANRHLRKKTTEWEEKDLNPVQVMSEEMERILSSLERDGHPWWDPDEEALSCCDLEEESNNW